MWLFTFAWSLQDTSAAQQVSDCPVQDAGQPPRPPAAPQDDDNSPAFAVQLVQQMQLPHQSARCNQRANADAEKLGCQCAASREQQLVLASSCASVFVQEDAQQPSAGSVGSLNSSNSKRPSLLGHSGRASRLCSDSPQPVPLPIHSQPPLQPQMVRTTTGFLSSACCRLCMCSRSCMHAAHATRGNSDVDAVAYTLLFI